MAVQVQLHGKNIDVTPALKAHVEKKLSRLGRFFDEELQVQVGLEVTKGRHIVEVTVPVGGFILRAEEATHDMYASIDGVWDKLERQVHKYKTRLNRKGRQEGGPHRGPAPAGPAPEQEEDDGLVRTKQFVLKPMHVDEAMLQMELLGHDFYLFVNGETDTVNVLYRRKDGGCGLIEPEL